MKLYKTIIKISGWSNKLKNTKSPKSIGNKY